MIANLLHLVDKGVLKKMGFGIRFCKELRTADSAHVTRIMPGKRLMLGGTR